MIGWGFAYNVDFSGLMKAMNVEFASTKTNAPKDGDFEALVICKKSYKWVTGDDDREDARRLSVVMKNKKVARVESYPSCMPKDSEIKDCSNILESEFTVAPSPGDFFGGLLVKYCPETKETLSFQCVHWHKKGMLLAPRELKSAYQCPDDFTPTFVREEDTLIEGPLINNVSSLRF